MSVSRYLYKVAVYVKGDDLDPSELTAKLNIEPSQSHRKGDKWLTSTNREVVEKTGLWSLSVDAGSRELSDIIHELALMLKIGKASMMPISGADEAYLDIFIAADADDTGGGACEFDLNEKCIRSINELRLPVRFTVAIVPV